MSVFAKLATVLELAAEELERAPRAEAAKVAHVESTERNGAKLAALYRDRTGSDLGADVVDKLDDPQVAEAVNKLAGVGAPVPLGGPSERSVEVVPETRSERRKAAYDRFETFLVNRGNS